MQGQYSYVYGPYAEPVLRVEPGDFIIAETADAFEGKIKRETGRVRLGNMVDPKYTMGGSVLKAYLA